MKEYANLCESVWNVNEVMGAMGDVNLSVATEYGYNAEFTYNECLLLELVHLEKLFPSYAYEDYTELDFIVQDYLAENLYLTDTADAIL